MKRVALLTSFVLILPLAASKARADIPPLPADLPAGKQSTSFQIRFDPAKDVTVLSIGRNVLERAEADAKQAAPEKRSETNPGSTRSIVAATALALGLAGVVVLRGRRGAQMVSGFVLAASLVAIGADAWANMPAPSSGELRAQRMASTLNLHGNPAWITTPDGQQVFNGQIVVQISDVGDSVQLQVGTKALPKREWKGPPVNSPEAPKSPFR